MKGRVKTYNELRGYGFIIGEDNNDYFMHISNVKSVDLPIQGSMVKFTKTENEKGLNATDIYVLGESQNISFIVFGNIRIKKNNIKNYGIKTKSYPYEKIYEIEKVTGKVNRFFQGSERYIWKNKIAKVSEKRHTNLKAVNEKEPGHYPFRADWDGVCTTFVKAIDSNGKIFETDIVTNEWTNEDNPPYVLKKIDTLFITTYQNDNYVFRQDECEFDIHEKCLEIDLSFSKSI